MEMSEILTAAISGMGMAFGVLFGMWRMVVRLEKRIDQGQRDLRDTITVTVTAAETRLGHRIDRLENRLESVDDRLRGVEQEFARVNQRLETIERIVLPAREQAG